MVTELSYLGFLKITGPDAKKFLQGQLTCNVETLAPNSHTLGAHCNPQGRILSLFRLFFYKDNYLMQMPKALVPIAFQALKKYAIFFKVTLEEANNEFSTLGILGQKEQAESHFPAQFIFTLTPSQHMIIEETSIIKSLPQETSPHNEETWRSETLAAGLAEIYPETSGHYLPHELMLPALGGVSFDKGCYTGQEIIARMQYRGKLKTYLAHTSIESASPPHRGASLYPNGSIVDFVKTGYNHYVLLCLGKGEDTLFLDETLKKPLLMTKLSYQ